MSLTLWQNTSGRRRLEEDAERSLRSIVSLSLEIRPHRDAVHALELHRWPVRYEFQQAGIHVEHAQTEPGDGLSVRPRAHDYNGLRVD